MAGRTIRRNRQGDSGNTSKGGDNGNEPVIEIIGDAGETEQHIELPGEVENTGTGTEAIDPASIGGQQPTSEPRRRGRKPGTRNKPKATATFEAGNLEKLLLSGHIMLAALCKAPELAIDAKESEILASAIAEVNAAYGLDSMVDPKIMSIVNLTFVVGTIYGPRLFLISHRAKKSKPILVPMPTQETKANASETPHPN